MRDYTEPAAEYDGALAAGTARSSWRTLGNGMSPNRWVECEGFGKLRISAVGDVDDSFTVYVFLSPLAAPVPDVLPTRYYGIVFPALSDELTGSFEVHQDVELAGAKIVGVQVMTPMGVAQERIVVRAFLLR